MNVRPLNATLLNSGRFRLLPRLAILVSAACLLAVNAGAQTADMPASGMPSGAAAVAVDTDQRSVDDYDALIKMAANHPNELFRLYAAKSAANGDWAHAAKMFRNAARYADKYSQHRLSLLYWHGVGMRADRVEGYIWADLAAERGYPQFLAIREKMWGELTPQQQAEAVSRGKKMYAEFGDPKAKKRFQTALAQGKRKITGSHTGFFNRLYVSTIGPDRQLFGSIGGANLDTMYDQARTDPKKYWEFEDFVWKNATVTVGEIEETSRQPAQTPKP